MSDGVTNAQQFYTRWARLYDFLARQTPGIHTLRTHASEALAPTRGDTVVEFGCGTGANFAYLHEQVGEEGTIIGVDSAPGMLARARDRVADAGWDNVHVVRGDATQPPVREADAVFASFVTGMLDAPGDAVADWCDLVGPGGRVALLDLARSTRPAGQPLNALFRGVVRASSPPGSRWQRGNESPTETLDRRVAAAHQALRDRCSGIHYSTYALGFARVSAGEVVGEE